MRHVAVMLSGLVHMVLVMMVLSPSRAVPSAVSGKPVQGDIEVTLTNMPRQPVRAVAARAAAAQTVTRLETPAPPKPPATERRFHFPLPKAPAPRPAEPTQETAAAQPVATLAVEPASVPAEPPGSSAPVAILHPKFRVPPEPAIYPPRALQMNQQGEVLVRATIDCDGTPDTVEVARGSGFPMLDEAALQAVRRWRFVPARIDGIAVAATVQVPVIFHLQ